MHFTITKYISTSDFGFQMNLIYQIRIGGLGSQSIGAGPWRAAAHNWRDVLFLSLCAYIICVWVYVFCIWPPVILWAAETGSLWLTVCTVFAWVYVCVPMLRLLILPAVMSLQIPPYSQTFAALFCLTFFVLAASSVKQVYTSSVCADTKTSEQKQKMSLCTQRRQMLLWVCWQYLCGCVIAIRLGSNKFIDFGKTELVDGVCCLQQAHLSKDLKRCLNLGERMGRAQRRPLRDVSRSQAISLLGFSSAASWFLLVARSIVN